MHDLQYQTPNHWNSSHPHALKATHHSAIPNCNHLKSLDIHTNVNWLGWRCRYSRSNISDLNGTVTQSLKPERHFTMCGEVSRMEFKISLVILFSILPTLDGNLEATRGSIVASSLASSRNPKSIVQNIFRLGHQPPRITYH